jgi:hypothetical protein
LDWEPHNMKCDFRTYTNRVYSATDGRVVSVKTGSSKGDSNYILVLSKLTGRDNQEYKVYVRYYHMDKDSIRVNINDEVVIGTVLGDQGTDMDAYPRHCDFAVNLIEGDNYNYNETRRIECTPILNNMWNVLSERAKTDPNLALDFTTLVCKHGKLKEL